MEKPPTVIFNFICVLYVDLYPMTEFYWQQSLYKYLFENMLYCFIFFFLTRKKHKKFVLLMPLSRQRRVRFKIILDINDLRTRYRHRQTLVARRRSTIVIVYHLRFLNRNDNSVWTQWTANTNVYLNNNEIVLSVAKYSNLFFFHLIIRLPFENKNRWMFFYFFRFFFSFYAEMSIKN